MGGSAFGSALYHPGMDDIRVVTVDENGSPLVVEVLVGDTWHRREVVPETADKACGNCGKSWPPEYGGQCDACGAPMNNIGPRPSLGTNGDVNSHLAGLRRTVAAGGSYAARMEASHGRSAQAETSHPAISQIKGAADPFAREVLEDLNIA